VGSVAIGLQQLNAGCWRAHSRAHKLDFAEDPSRPDPCRQADDRNEAPAPRRLAQGAAIALAAGLARVFFAAKSTSYYGANMVFWLKMALFAAIALISIAPTYSFIVWRRRARAEVSFRPPQEEIARLRAALYVEAALFAAIPLCAAAMARGYGIWAS
jgi:uncharacterized membrane protein